MFLALFKWILTIFCILVVSGIALAFFVFAMSCTSTSSSSKRAVVATIAAFLGLFIFCKGNLGVIHHFFSNTYTSANHVAPSLWGQRTEGNDNTPAIFFHAYSVDLASDDTDGMNGYNGAPAYKYSVKHITKVSSNITKITLDNSDQIMIHSKNGKLKYASLISPDEDDDNDY